MDLLVYLHFHDACCADQPDLVLCCAVQVLVSIQSLILVPQPYFNEPGFEQRGDMAASKQYNEVRTAEAVLHCCN